MKQTFLFFDTETSGFPKKLSHNDPNQSWCCQIGAISTSYEGEVLAELDVLIKANGRDIPPFIQQLTGITPEMTMEKGVEELEAIEQFVNLMSGVSKYVCHNYDFDSQFINHLFLRNMDDLSDLARYKYFIPLPYFCTMKDRDIVKYVGLKNKIGKPKWPKLEELYFHLFEKNFDNAHNAMADVRATKDCFFELIKREVIKL